MIIIDYVGLLTSFNSCDIIHIRRWQWMLAVNTNMEDDMEERDIMLATDEQRSRYIELINMPIIKEF
jgi:hypothetical protein